MPAVRAPLGTGLRSVRPRDGFGGGEEERSRGELRAGAGAARLRPLLFLELLRPAAPQRGPAG